MLNYILAEYLETKNLFETIIADVSLQKKIKNISEVCYTALKNKQKIIFCGNGGSAADSQHLAAELVSRFNYDRPALSALALTVDTSALTAIGNDYGYEEVFSRQVEAIGNEGDILFGLSTSGNSKNVIKAISTAKDKKIITIGLLGQNNGAIGELTDYQINIPSKKTPKIQEGHITTGHIICGLIENMFFKETYGSKNV